MNKAHLPRIRDLCQQLRSGADYLHGAFTNDEDKESAIDLFEHETHIMPAAWKILDNFRTLHAQDKAALETPILFGTRLRKIPDGSGDQEQTWEVGHLEPVLRQAQILEDLRAACLRCMNEA